MIVGKPTSDAANKTGELAGRNGHKLTKTRINLANVDFPHMIQKITELGISQLGCQLQAVTLQ